MGEEYEEYNPREEVLSKIREMRKDMREKTYAEIMKSADTMRFFANIVCLGAPAHPYLIPLHIAMGVVPIKGEKMAKAAGYIGVALEIGYAVGGIYAFLTGNDITPWIMGLVASYSLLHSAEVAKNMELYKKLV